MGGFLKRTETGQKKKKKNEDERSRPTDRPTDQPIKEEISLEPSDRRDERSPISLPTHQATRMNGSANNKQWKEAEEVTSMHERAIN